MGNRRAMSAFFTLKVSDGDNIRSIIGLEVKKVYVQNKPLPATYDIRMVTSQVQQDNITY